MKLVFPVLLLISLCFLSCESYEINDRWVSWVKLSNKYNFANKSLEYDMARVGHSSWNSR